MQPSEVLKESFFYKMLACLSALFTRHKSSSLIVGFLTRPPSYTGKEAADSSAFFTLAGKLARLLMTPVAAAGAVFRRSLPGSRINSLKVPAVMENCLAWRVLAGIRVETALWGMVLFPIIDYLLRNVESLEALAGPWDKLLLLFIAVTWPLQMALRGKITWRRTMMDMPILIFIGIILFLFFIRSPDASLAMEGARVYIEYLFWYFAATNLITNRRQLDALATGLIAVTTLLALIGIYQYIVGVEIPASWVDQAEAGVRTRVFSLVTSPNVLGSLLVLFIPMTISRIINLKHKLHGQLIYAACLAAMLACLIFTYSRGAWLALVAALALYSFMYSPKMLLMMTLGGLAGLKFVPGIGSRLSYMLSADYLVSSQRAGRLDRWGIALDRLKENPWFGEGLGRFGGAVAARRIPGSFYVDNFYLKTAVESGLIGLLALVWLLLNAFRLGLDTVRRLTDDKTRLLAVGMLAGLIGVILHNGVENIFEVPMMVSYFWFVTGMLAAAPEVEKI